MVTFILVSGRYIRVSPTTSMPYYYVLHNGILDVDMVNEAVGVEWDAAEGHPILLEDPQPEYELVYHRAPDQVYNEIMLSQKHANEIPGVSTPFVSIVDGSAYRLNADGSLGEQLQPGEYIPVEQVPS